MVKTEVLKELESKKGSPVSGEALAHTLGVSRTAVWKAINTLKKDGYSIQTINGKGYILAENSNKLSPEGISTHMETNSEIYFFSQVESTNTTAIGLATSGAPDKTLVVAEQQTKGKGRRGRSFYSPKDDGIYMSIILKPQVDMQKSVLITTAASVAVAKAVKDICNVDVQIKWVNDIYLDGKKICGILTEAVTDFESGQISHVIVGIGINCFNKSVAGELKDVVGALNITELDRNKLIARVADRLFDVIAEIEDGNNSFIEYYRNMSMLIGKNINVYKSTMIADNTGIPAKALDIDENGGLVIRLEDGSIETLSTGEVSVRLG